MIIRIIPTLGLNYVIESGDFVVATRPLGSSFLEFSSFMFLVLLRLLIEVADEVLFRDE